MNSMTVQSNKNKTALTSLSILHDIYIIFNCTVASFVVCCCAVWAAETYSSKNLSAWTGKREYSMCQSTRGQCKIPLPVIHPANSSPTWNNSHKTCCRLPISSGCFPPWSAGLRSDYRGKTRPQSAYERRGDSLVWPFSRDSTLIWEEGTIHLRECVFRHNNKQY